jgi:UMF1 family MFS transporter
VDRAPHVLTRPVPSRSLLARIGLDRPELRAWALYDWANSAFVTTVVTAVFPDFFASVASSGAPPATATTRFAMATTVAVALVALVAPGLGVLADRTAIKKTLLASFAALGIVATAAMPFIGHGDWQLAALLFIIANVGMNGSLVFYDSLLPHIAGPGELDRVSAAGFAIGYLGGGLLLALNLAWILSPASFGLPDTITAVRLTFLSVAVWWAVFTLPLLTRVTEPRVTRERRTGSFVRETWRAFGHLKGAVRELRTYRPAFLMLLAFLLYNDGIQTIIRMASIYGAEIGIGRDERIMAFVMVQFLGVPFAFLFGQLAARLGAKPSLFLSLAVYALIAVIGYFMTTTAEFFVLAALVATVQGGSQALSRSLFASMIPRRKSAEFFGFFSVFEKMAGVLGPALFGLTTALTGSSRGAVLAVIAFFVGGAAVLTLVDVAKGQALAARADRNGGTP